MPAWSRHASSATFFFFGLQIDVGDLTGVLPIAAVLAVLTAGTKVATGWWAARRGGISHRGRVRAGLALVARGEFSVVIAELGIAAGLEPRLGPLAAGYVLILAIAGPLLMRWSPNPQRPYRSPTDGTVPTDVRPLRPSRLPRPDPSA